MVAVSQLRGEERPFRRWDRPAPQDVECRLAHWTESFLFLETEDRQFVLLEFAALSESDRTRFADESGGLESSPVPPERLKSQVHFWAKDGSAIDSGYPVAFNGRYVLFRGWKDKRLQPLILQFRDLSKKTQSQIGASFENELSIEEMVYATGPYRESLWIANETRSLTDLAPDIGDDFTPYPADTYLLAVDGERYFFETRLEGEPKDPSLYPRFVTATWSDVGRRELNPLLQWINREYALQAKRSPTAAIPSVRVAHNAAGRGKPGPMGARRMWNQTMMQEESKAMPARLLLRNSRNALALRDDGAVDIVEYLTAEDAEYLDSVEGFWTANHDSSKPTKYQAAATPIFSRNLAALFRDYDGDEETIAELEDGLVPPVDVEPGDRSDYRERRLQKLARIVLGSDRRHGDVVTARVREAVRREELTFAEGTRLLGEIQKRKVDPTDGDTPAEKLIIDWKRLRPDSPHPWLVAAIARHDHAWQLRVGGYAHKVDSAGAEGFSRYVADFGHELDDAESIAPEDPIVACWRLAYGRCAGHPREAMEAIVARAEAADPLFARPHYEMAFYLSHRWYGEFGDDARYVRDFVRRRPGPMAVDLFIQVYATHIRTEQDVLRNGLFDAETLAAVTQDAAELAQPGDRRWPFAEVLAYASDDVLAARKLIAKAGGIEWIGVATSVIPDSFPDDEARFEAKRFFEQASETPDVPAPDRDDST